MVQKNGKRLYGTDLLGNPLRTDGETDLIAKGYRLFLLFPPYPCDYTDDGGWTYWEAETKRELLNRLSRAGYVYYAVCFPDIQAVERINADNAKARD